MLRNHEIFAYATRTWTCAPMITKFEALKVHLGKLYVSGKLGFPGGRMKRLRDISDLWKIINTELTGGVSAFFPEKRELIKMQPYHLPAQPSISGPPWGSWGVHST